MKQADSNGDVISTWCTAGFKPWEALCVICNEVINCSQHGVSAVKRHARNKKHIEACKVKRTANGILKPASQLRIMNASNLTLCGSLCNSHADLVTSAETLFTVAIASDSVPYSFADTGTKIFPRMFQDSSVARDFNCKRSKVSYIVSDGLGPYLKNELISDIVKNNCFYSIQIDDTPIPEKRIQQMDIAVRYFSEIQGRVVVHHLQSYHLGHATASDMFASVKDALTELPLSKLLSFFSDGPNVMKALKSKMKELNVNILDLGECSLHKVHNAFARGLDAFGGDVESLVIDIYLFFKRSAVQSEELKKLQIHMGLPEHFFLRHVNSRWLTLQSSLDRIIEQFSALQTFFKKQTVSRTESERLSRLSAAFADHKLLAKMLFLRNVADIFNEFLTLFQKDEPLVHILYDELELLVRKLMGRFLVSKSFHDKVGAALKSVDVESCSNWKQKVEVGLDTEKNMASLSVSEKKFVLLGARSFYMACTKYLLNVLPLDNSLLQLLRVLQPSMRKCDDSVKMIRALASRIPNVIAPEDVASLTDEWIILQSETFETSATASFSVEESDDSECIEESEDHKQLKQPSQMRSRVDHYWGNVFARKNATGNFKYKLIPLVVKALLCLAHGNAECERGFSCNKQLLEGRSHLNIESINGLRKVKSHLQSIGGIDNFKMTPTLVKTVQKSRSAYRARLELEKHKVLKRKAKESTLRDEKRLKQEESEIQSKLNSSQQMLKIAEASISNGIKKKSMADIESGNVLLNEARGKISRFLIDLDKNRKEQAQLASVKKKTF